MFTLRYISVWKVFAPYKGVADDFKAVWDFRAISPYLLVDMCIWALIIKAWASVTTMAILCLLVLGEHAWSRCKLFKELEYVVKSVQKETSRLGKKYGNTLNAPVDLNVIYFNSGITIAVGVVSFLFPVFCYQGAKHVKQKLYSFYRQQQHFQGNDLVAEEHSVYLTGLRTFWRAYSETRSDAVLQQWVEFLFLHEYQHVKQFQYKPKSERLYHIAEDRSYNFYDIQEPTLEMYDKIMCQLHTLFTPRQLAAITHVGLLELDADLQTVYYMAKNYNAVDIVQIWRTLRKESTLSYYMLSRYFSKHVTVSNILHADTYAQFIKEVVQPISASISCVQLIKALEAEDYETAMDIIVQS
jgi:hypothetical protein